MFTPVLAGQFTRDRMVFPGFVRRDFKEVVGNFECREDDVFVVSYPRSGTTWVIEMVSLILNGANTESNRKGHQFFRSPVLEVVYADIQRYMWILRLMIRYKAWLPNFVWKHVEFMEESGLESADAVKYLKTMESPRVIKSHLPFQFLPKQAMEKKSKIVYVSRNPKDTLVSYYYFHRSCKAMDRYVNPWSDFYKMFKDKTLGYGDWFDHVLGWWAHRDEENVCFLKYEDIMKDSRGTLLRLARFLGKDLTDENVETILEYVKFENMQENRAVNHCDVTRSEEPPFIRKGIVGDWKNHFTVAQNVEFEELYEERMRSTGLTYEW